jgi:hypothetical protein
MEAKSINTSLLHSIYNLNGVEGKGKETLSSLIIFHHVPTAAKLSSLRMLETDTFIIERAQAHKAHANKPPVPAYDRPHLRGPWSRLVGGWCEAKEKREEKEEREERGIFKACKMPFAFPNRDNPAWVDYPTALLPCRNINNTLRSSIIEYVY